jgi:hypothetical protein
MATKTTSTMHPFEINGNKYLICKLLGQPFSTLHDPATKQIVGQWDNHAGQYEIFPTDAEIKESREFEMFMRNLISSGKAFTFVE